MHKIILFLTRLRQCSAIFRADKNSSRTQHIDTFNYFRPYSVVYSFFSLRLITVVAVND
jgi:hypothetical protein